MTAAAEPGLAAIAAGLRFFFIRHGETDWNREGRLQGQRDIPLNPRGRDQARAAGRMLARLAADCGFDLPALDFVASPLGRTLETMRLLRQSAGLNADAFRTDARLKELSFGQWEGRTWSELKREDPGGMARRKADKWRFVPPGGESYADLVERVLPAVQPLAPGAVVVSHGGVARALLQALAGFDERTAQEADIWQGRVLAFGTKGALWH